MILRLSDKASGKDHPGGRDVFNALRQGCAAVLVCPEGREQQQFSGFGSDLYILVGKLCFTAGASNRVQVPDGNQLPLAEFMAAAINVPVIKLARIGALNGVAAVLERATKERECVAKFLDGLAERAKQFTVDVVPVGFATDDQVG